MSHVYCQECGFQNPEAANYCARCGALIAKEQPSAEATMSYTFEEGEDDPADVAEQTGVPGPALVVRSGGGRAGETFHPDGERTTIGRSPDCEIFLDDVTVSRKHAVIARHGSKLTIEDLGSLNGTFVNRRRVESAPLGDGDEIQIGKYRLSYLQQ